MFKPQFSVVIPAHNEETVIGRCLSSLGDFAREGEVVVAANGCSDRTEDVARSFQGVTVIDSQIAGKATAIRAAEVVCSAFPRVYIDADVTLSGSALEALVDCLSTPEPRAAAPEVVFDVASCSPLVQAFYRSYQAMPYVTNGLVGLGVYGLSAAGRSRFDVFPELVADDLFVQRLFRREERVVLHDHHFTVRAPRTLRDLLVVRTRTVRGNRQLQSRAARVGAPVNDPSRAVLDLVRRARVSPRSAMDAAVYAAVVSAARVHAAGKSDRPWERDLSSREADQYPRHEAKSEPDLGAATPRVAYLVSQYPALSHTFIHREVSGLRQVGFDVTTFTVRSCPRSDLRSPQLREEANRTRAIREADRNLQFLLRLAKVLVRWAPDVFGLARSMAGGEGLRLRGRLWQLFYLGEAVLLLDWLRKDDLHHVHVHFANNAADIARAACELARRRGHPMTWSLTVHGPAEFMDPIGIDLAGKVASASAVACISDFCRSSVASLVPNSQWPKLSVIRTGVLPEAFPPKHTDDDAEDLVDEGLTGAEDAVRILYVGRLVPEKRPLDLVRAMARLHEQGVDLRARFVGAGPLEDALRTAVRAAALGSVVELVGPQSESEVPAHFAWADVFCLPSEAEGLPVVLMEAMSSELAVVTTRIAAIPELVSHGETGMVVETGDVDGLTEAMETLIMNPDVRQKMGRSGRAVVLEKYDAYVNAASMGELLRVLVEPSGRGDVRGG